MSELTRDAAHSKLRNEVPQTQETISYVIATGNPADGFTHYGPFDDAEAGGEWAEINLRGEEWWGVSLYGPIDTEPDEPDPEWPPPVGTVLYTLNMGDWPDVQDDGTIAEATPHFVESVVVGHRTDYGTVREGRTVVRLCSDNQLTDHVEMPAHMAHTEAEAARMLASSYEGLAFGYQDAVARLVTLAESLEMD